MNTHSLAMIILDTDYQGTTGTWNVAGYLLEWTLQWRWMGWRTCSEQILSLHCRDRQRWI